MLKLPENKTRKKLRITQCVFYLILVLLCTFTYVRIPNPNQAGQYFYATVFDMLGYIGGTFPNIPAASALQSYIPFYFIFPVIPVVGFFFCALDKERNMKNIVSLICCLLGVVSILFIVTLNFIDIGSTLSLIIYVFLSFITTIAMMARVVNTSEKK